MGLKTPVLLIIFNRPDTTRQVFDAIRRVQPKQLFVAADGPREDQDGERQKCQRTREIVNQVDWECEVRTLFHERNLGCGPGPATAINWFFENVEEGIILEDDCLPHPDFFVYCEKLLDRYRNSKRIMHISGNNYQDRRKRGHASYYFSMYTHNSGWATWRRAWQHFDFTCISAERRRDLWDSQWQISVMRRNGLAILPNVNLVSDIGVGHPDATHTYMIPPSGIRPIFSIPLPLVHPKNISRDRAADRYTWYIYFKRHTMKDKVIRIILDFIPDMMKPVLRKVAPCWSVEKQ